MPEINFDEVPDADDYTVIPEGEYLVQLINIDTSKEDEKKYWNLKFEVQKGEYKGRFVWDKMFFTEDAMKRVKLICSRLGIDVSGTVNLTPEILQDRLTWLTVEIEEYEKFAGEMRELNNVPFAGYRKVMPEDEKDISHEKFKSEAEDELPF